MATTPITLVMPYYENPGMLREHYNFWGSMPPDIKDMLKVIVVDDGSPSNPAKPPPAEEKMGVQLSIYRIKVDIRWNQDAARNIGVKHAENGWLLLTDMDHLVPQETWKSIMYRKFDPLVAYTFARVNYPKRDPYKHHPNSWLMHRELYERIGGYDERFAGYYGTDGDFRVRLQRVAQIAPLKECLLRVPRECISDASTTKYRRKEPFDRPKKG